MTIGFGVASGGGKKLLNTFGVDQSTGNGTVFGLDASLINIITPAVGGDSLSKPF
jgi:hypothetical protein